MVALSSSCRPRRPASRSSASANSERISWRLDSSRFMRDRFHVGRPVRTQQISASYQSSANLQQRDPQHRSKRQVSRANAIDALPRIATISSDIGSQADLCTFPVANQLLVFILNTHSHDENVYMARIQLILPDEDRDRFQHQAKREGLTMSAWLRAAAKELLAKAASIPRFESVEQFERSLPTVIIWKTSSCRNRTGNSISRS